MSVSVRDPRVGVGIIIVRNRKVLVGKRKGSHAEGLIAFPGGSLEWGEDFETCVLREIREECGPNLKVRLFPRTINDNHVTQEWLVTNNVMPEYDKHYVTLFFVANYLGGEAVNAEPEKCEGWEWVDFETLERLAANDTTADWIPIELLREIRREAGF